MIQIQVDKDVLPSRPITVEEGWDIFTFKNKLFAKSDSSNILYQHI